MPAPESAPAPAPSAAAAWRYGLAALGVLLLLVVLPRLALHRHPLVGKPAPDFSLDVIYNGEPGSKLQLAKLQGKPVLLAFWATWCGVCRAETPTLNRVAERYKDRGLIVVGVDTADKPGLGASAARRLGMVYPVVYDDGGVDDLYGVEALPTLVMVGRDGNVQAVRVGLADESSLDALVGAALLRARRPGPAPPPGGAREGPVPTVRRPNGQRLRAERPPPQGVDGSNETPISISSSVDLPRERGTMR
jgi:thiol-disulfide isomerase/thioredoxin